MTPDRENIRFNVLRNALYHTARRRTFERRDRFFNFLVVVLGTAAAADALAAFDVSQVWIGLAVAVIGALQLVFDFGGLARLHTALQRDYYLLLADIEANPDASAKQCAGWQSRMIRITADEPPLLRAIDAKAYNDALDATSVEASAERLHIPFRHRLLGGLIPFEGARYSKLSELGRSP
ncbi:MAG: hypothetical protein ACOY5U_02315 [Pseudomonadota bacterium]